MLRLVYVVTWEYPTSRDGYVAGVVGVAATPEGGLRLAQAEAVECRALRDEEQVIRIVDETGTEHGDHGSDWDLWLEVLELEVQE